MLYYVYLSNAGAPATGLTPDWEHLVTAENGTDKSASAPTITEIGGGWYHFDITFGTAPWDVTGEDLAGVIDAGATLSGNDRYKPVMITLRGLGLARIAHKGIQTKSTGDVDIYATDGATKEMTLDMTDGVSTITRAPTAPSA